MLLYAERVRGCMNEVVLSLGGSLIVPDGIDVLFLKKFRSLILKHVKKGTRFFIITGGGKLCRDYQAAADKIRPLSESEKDWVGIHVTRLNANLIRTLFKPLSWKHILGDPQKRMVFGKKDMVIVGAGWAPGWSSDYDAVLIAKTYGVDTIINLTNVDYAYDKDPRFFKSAKRLKAVSWPAFKKVVGRSFRSGMHVPFDPKASALASRLGLTAVITNGRDLRNLDKLLRGLPAKGTVVGQKTS